MIYKYGGVPNCSLDDIDRSIEKIIKAYYEKKQARNKYKQEQQYLVKTRTFLEEIIQKQIILIHSKIHKGEKSENELAYEYKIPFSEFIKKLDDNLNDYKSSSYYLHLTRNDLNQYYQEFCLDLEEEEDVTKNDKIKLNSYIFTINQMDEKQIVEFVRYIIPHRKFTLETIFDYKHDNIQMDEMKLAFFTILHELRKNDVSEYNHLAWQDNLGNYYLPTSINDGNREKNKLSICKRILENFVNTDFKTAYDSQNMVTSNMDVDSIGRKGGKFFDTDFNAEYKKHDPSKKITAWNDIALISLDNAKDIINENDN
ncbi:hypothetical protein DMA11_23495 [Marinilabiliaceae bacterium JC017]|nr:hypothetical protein DMA11_23495 [Marinilabiliaceae bacterium JC017]